MIHVPDVRATATWYVGTLGFELVSFNEEDGDMNWARLSFGGSSIMFSAGGKPSDAHRREVDLYILVQNLEELFTRLRDKVDVFEAPHDTFYGMREFIIRDLNRFWITFGQPIKPAQ